MTVAELIEEGKKFIHKDQAKLILGVLLKKNPLELTFHLDLKVSNEIVLKYKKCLNSLKQGIPLQYALNSVNFLGTELYIDERVLIPRFETEELVDNTFKYLKKYFSNDIKILDLCTGSGCCGLILKKFNNKYKVTLSDISNDALTVAKKNAKKLKLDVCFVKSDIFSNLKDKYDVIISNPPYVSNDDQVAEIVLNNEPKIALYAGKTGLEFYEKILKTCEKYLNDKYLIGLEIGNKQKQAVCNLVNMYLKDVKIITKKDLAGFDRMIFIFKNIELE